jgi:hypothetical protein
MVKQTEDSVMNMKLCEKLKFYVISDGLTDSRS